MTVRFDQKIPKELMKDWQLQLSYAYRAMELAKRGKTAPNPMVGAVLVKAGKVYRRGISLICGWPACGSGGLKKSRVRKLKAQTFMLI